MRRKIKTTTLVLSFVLTSLIFVFNGCTRYANQEDLEALERQKQAALSAEQRIQDLEGEKSDLEREIARLERELSEKEETLREIRGR